MARDEHALALLRVKASPSRLEEDVAAGDGVCRCAFTCPGTAQQDDTPLYIVVWV